MFTHKIKLLLLFAFLVLLEYTAYYLIAKLTRKKYLEAIKHRVPLSYVMFKVYDKSFLNNLPTKRGKEFYRFYNKLTIVFNILIALTLIAFFYVSAYVKEIS